MAWGKGSPRVTGTVALDESRQHKLKGTDQWRVRLEDAGAPEGSARLDMSRSRGKLRAAQIAVGPACQHQQTPEDGAMAAGPIAMGLEQLPSQGLIDQIRHSCLGIEHKRF